MDISSLTYHITITVLHVNHNIHYQRTRDYIMLFLTQTGAYHTLDVEQNRKFTITKAIWDSISLERVDTACDLAQVRRLKLMVLCIR